MLKYLKFIETLISLQIIFISAFIPIFITFPNINNSNQSLEIPITWQIPTIILLSLLFSIKVVFRAVTIYIIFDFFYCQFFMTGVPSYLLTPNFGYLIGIYPLITIISKLNKAKI